MYKMIVKMCVYSFVPTSLLGLLYLFEINIHGTALGNIIAIIIVPVYLSCAGSTMLLKYSPVNITAKALIVVISILGTINGIHMVFMTQEIWQYVLFMPTHLDGIGKIVINTIIFLSMIVLGISYPITYNLIKGFLKLDMVSDGRKS